MPVKPALALVLLFAMIFGAGIAFGSSVAHICAAIPASVATHV